MARSAQTLDTARRLAEKICRDKGIELFDVVLLGSGGRAIVKVFIDCHTGITVEDCATVSRELSTALDVEDLIRNPYRLEVSSPGLDRPIRNSEDAGKMIGKLISVMVKKEINGRKNFKGRLDDVRDDVWVLSVDGEEMKVNAEFVEKANLVFEF